MEAVSMRIADQHISGIWYVDSIWEVGVVLAANAAHKLTFLVEHDNAVTLEVADEKFLAWNSRIRVDKKFCYFYVVVCFITANGNVGRLSHVVTAVKPTQQVARFSDDEDCWGYTVNGHNLSDWVDSKASNNVNVSKQFIILEIILLSKSYFIFAA